MTKNLGRYGSHQDYTMPGELPGRGVAGKARIVYGFVPEPNAAIREDGKVRSQKVAINANTDVLEREYQARRISQEAYDAGRAYEIAMASTVGDMRAIAIEPSAGPGDRTRAIVGRLDAARSVVALRSHVDRAIGENRRAILECVLLEGWSFAQVAEMLARPPGIAPSRMKQHAAEYWRQSIEALGREWPNIRA